MLINIILLRFLFILDMAISGDCRTVAETHSHPPTQAMTQAFDQLLAEVE